MLENKTKNKSKRKRQFKFDSQSVARFLILTAVLLVLLLVAESGQIFFQFKELAKKTLEKQYPVYPVYIVESQGINLEAYLVEYFAAEIPKKTMYVTVTAYSSTESQTDGTPFLTAYGTPVREGIVAANFLPVGTVVRFPDKFGDKLFIVEDRMDERFGLQVDIWMFNQDKAKEFGIQYLKMDIF